MRVFAATLPFLSALVFFTPSLQAAGVNNIYVTSKAKIEYSINYGARHLYLRHTGSETRSGKCQFVTRLWAPGSGSNYGKGYYWSLQRWGQPTVGQCSLEVNLDRIKPGSNRVILNDPYPASGGVNQIGWISFNAYP